MKRLLWKKIWNVNFVIPFSFACIFPPPPPDISARPFMRIVHSICSITRCTMHLSAQYKQTRAVSSPIQSPPPPPSNRLKSINRSDFQIEILSFLLEFDFCRIFQFQFQLQILQFLKKISNSYVYNMNYKRSVIFPPPSHQYFTSLNYVIIYSCLYM